MCYTITKKSLSQNGESILNNKQMIRNSIILYSNTVTRARMAPRAAPLRPPPICRSHPTVTLHVVGRVLGGESLRCDRRDDFSKSIFWSEVILPPFSWLREVSLSEIPPTIYSTRVRFQMRVFLSAFTCHI